MNSFVLIPWPETVWSAVDRIATRTPLPLTDVGQTQARAWAEGLAGVGLSVIYSSDERTSVETARIVANSCRARHRMMPVLAEVDAGLWEALTTDELRRRYPKIFKRWYDDPSSVCPPEGEDLEDARERLRESLARVVRKHSGENVAVVLGPLAFALARCVIESVEPARARSLIHDKPLRYEFADGVDTLPSGLSASQIGGSCEREVAQPQGSGDGKGGYRAG